MSKVAGQTTSNQRQLPSMQLLEAHRSRDCWNYVRAFEERLNTILPLLAQVPGFEVIKPMEPSIFTSKSYGDKGFARCDSFYHSYEEVGVALVTETGSGALWKCLSQLGATDLKHWRKLSSVWSNLRSAKAWGKSPGLQCWQLASVSSLTAALSVQSRLDHCFQSKEENPFICYKCLENAPDSIQWQWFS